MTALVGDDRMTEQVTTAWPATPVRDGDAVEIIRARLPKPVLSAASSTMRGVSVGTSLEGRAGRLALIASGASVSSVSSAPQIAAVPKTSAVTK